MSRVNAIVASYNGEKTLTSAISSILSQTYSDLDLLLVDDGSTDSTANLLKNYKDPRIKHFQLENSGSPAKPRNFGIARAGGDFIAFCDQDDLWHPEKLEKQLEAYDSSSEKENIGIIISSADLIDESGRHIGLNDVGFTGYMDPETAYRNLLSGNFITACSAMVPKAVIDEVGPLDESLRGVDDYDLWLRICKKYGILAIREPLCSWRQSTGSLSADKAKQYLEVEKIFAKLDSEDQTVRLGHGKNILRIIMASLLSEDYKQAKKYLDEIGKYPASLKSKLVIGTIRVSPAMGRWLITLLGVKL